ncbi:MAG TPA: Ig-like domain-containing protein [Candidatus Deferrimicrobium sp.]|nr:Ig-like domain-containing protein [Candidatus Deferrimicrobium sp.]
MKILNKGFKKSIALIVIAAFIFQIDTMLHPQVEVEIVKQFQRAKSCYANGRYDDAEMRLQRVMDIINEKNIDRKDILGMCCLLLGAIAEKENKLLPAAGHYRKAREVYGITLVDGIDLEELSLYKELVKGVVPPSKGTIEAQSVKKKKKFPWLLAAGGVVVAGVLVYFLLLKPKKYQLAVTRGEGVSGTPLSNTYSYKKGTRVMYNYSSELGYSQPVVTLDGNIAPLSGTVEMNRHHILTAFSTLNVVALVTDREIIEIPGGKSIPFQVKLSAQPRTNINVTVNHTGGDPDIQVVTNSLVFTTANWNTYQPVILQAVEDADAVDDEAAIRLSAPGNTNILSKEIKARENDEDHPTISITVPTSGNTLSGEVSVTAEAKSAAKIVRVEFYIDWKNKSTDIKAPYIYKWNTLNVPNGMHIIKAVAYDIEAKSATHEISVNVANGPIHYTLSVYKEEGIDGSPLPGDTSYAKGEIVSYHYALLPGSSNLVVLLDNREAAPDGNITMDRDHELRALADPLLYSLVVDMKTGVTGNPGSGTTQYKGDDTISYFYTLQDGYYDLEVKLDDTLLENPGSFPINSKDHHLVVDAKIGFETNTDQIIICEGKTKMLGVKLSAQPANPVTALVHAVNGDNDIHVDAGENLVFTPNNWNVFQYVTLNADDDNDTEDGQVTIVIEAPGLYALNIAAKEHDTTADPRPRITLSGVSEGQAIAGSVIIGAVITDDDGIIETVELYIDGVLKDKSNQAIYKYEWNTAGVAPGEHKIKIIAYDMCGLPGEKEITVLVGNS